MDKILAFIDEPSPKQHLDTIFLITNTPSLMNNPSKFFSDKVVKIPRSVNQAWLLTNTICYLWPIFYLKNASHWTYKLKWPGKFIRRNDDRCIEKHVDVFFILGQPVYFC